MTQTRKWSLLTALVVVGTLLAGWLLLVSPERSQAAGLREEAQLQLDANASLQLKISQLRTQAEELPAQRARLAEHARSIPESPQLPTLIRNLTEAAKATGADLRSVAPGQPTSLLDPTAAPVAGAAAPTEGADAEGAPVESAPVESAEGAPADGADASSATATPRPLLYIPLTVTTEGSYATLAQFVNKLEDLDRSLLLTGLSVSGEPDEESGSLKITAVVQARVFLSPEGGASSAPPSPSTSPSAQPTPPPGQ